MGLRLRQVKLIGNGTELLQIYVYDALQPLWNGNISDTMMHLNRIFPDPKISKAWIVWITTWSTLTFNATAM